MARQWILTGQEGFDKSLEYQENIKLPSADHLQPNQILVRMHAASLNYRELVIPSAGGFNGPIRAPVVPVCDGTGVVEAVGSAVKDFQPKDRVVTYFAPGVAEAGGDDAFGIMRDVIAILSEKAFVHAPKSLEWLPAATLTCTWSIAWNVLFGLKGREAGPGSWVLVQGSGGVSVAVLQLAAAAGVTIVATTSTADRAARLRALGAAHTVNYRENADGCGKEARLFTPGGKGFDFVVDVGGNETLPQSLVAVRADGIVLVVGGVGANAQPVPLFAAMIHSCIVHGIAGGTRGQLREAVRYIDEKGIQPAVDDVVSELAEGKEA